MSKIIAYACSTRPNALWSAAQYNSALPKNRTECDIPLVALSDLESERHRHAEVMEEVRKVLGPFAFEKCSLDITRFDEDNQAWVAIDGAGSARLSFFVRDILHCKNKVTTVGRRGND